MKVSLLAMHDPPMRMLSLGYVMIYQRGRMILLPIIVVKRAESSLLSISMFILRLDVLSGML